MQLLPQRLNFGAALKVHILDAAQDAGLLAAQRLDWGLRTTPTGEAGLMQLTGRKGGGGGCLGGCACVGGGGFCLRVLGQGGGGGGIEVSQSRGRGWGNAQGGEGGETDRRVYEALELGFLGFKVLFKP